MSKITIIQPSDLDGITVYVDPLDHKVKSLQSGGTGGVTPIVYAIDGVAEFTSRHGRTYSPSFTLLDADGDLCDTDVEYAPGMLTLTFAQPFTGTLTVF